MASTLRSLFLSAHPLILLETAEEDRALGVLRETAGDLGLTPFEWSVTDGLRHLGAESSLDGRTTNARQALQHAMDLQMPAVFVFKDLAAFWDEPPVARALKDFGHRFAQGPSVLVVIGSPGLELPSTLAPVVFRHGLALPDPTELAQVLDQTLRGLALRVPLQVDLTPEDRGRLLQALTGLTANQARQAIARAILEDGRLDGADIADTQRRKAAALRDGGLLEYYPAEDNPGEVGGFENLQNWLNRAALGFSAEARAMRLDPPRGVLLVGVPGCGKSLAAKTIARQWDLPLLKLDAGRLYDKYIGESEKNFLRATKMAESMAPCVLWIDEMEKAFATGGEGGSDGGTTQRTLGLFLTWLQEKKETVFLAATANQVDRLPPELLRKGRFDEIFFIDLPTAAERLAILEIHLRQRNQEPGRVDLARFAGEAESFSGAEIEQVVISGLYQCLERRCPLSTEILLEELRRTVPLAVSREEEITRLRAFAVGRFVPASSVPQP
ncbi:MAG: AAA family ATPase [Verrucomicrobia bacterium]|nr:AAA family ATPase [Verrucomicrobiota bacterium]